MKKDIKSFTLLELIIVVVILGILAALAIPMYTNTVEQRKGEACIINMKIIIAAEEIYYSKNGNYWPAPVTSNDNLSQINSNLNINIQDSSFTYTVYNYNYDNPNRPFSIGVFGNRNSGPYQGEPLSESTNIEGRYSTITDLLTWHGGWFIGILADPPSFPLPE